MPNEPDEGAGRPDRVVEIFKCLADPARLRMIGLMVEEPRCGRELASELHLAPATVSHHLRRLQQAGLVRERRDGAYVFYRLDHAALRDAVQAVTDRKKVVELAAAPGLAKDQRKVLESFFDGDRLLRIPAQRSKKEIVFEEILRRLPKREVYSERELSAMLERFHSDFCTIRRELIMGRYMERENQRYRLAARGRAVVDSM
jgi:biotin operon repressor